VSASLEEFTLKSQNLGRMTGVSIGVHAIPDAFLLMHTGVGCKYKAASQIASHDWQRHPNRREGWTEVGDRALIEGSAQRIGPYVRIWYERRRPAFMAMVTSTFLEMTGEDFSAELRKSGGDVPCPLVAVPARGFEGDLFEGYASLLIEVVKQVKWSRPSGRKREATVMGYFFDRYEADHIGNLQQLRHLFAGIGLNLGPVFLSGRPFSELMNAGGSDVLIQLPYARPVEEDIGRVTGREIIATDLPMGLTGTARWVREVAHAVRVADEDKVEQFISTQLEHARPHLAKLADRMGCVRVAIFAETPLAAGLCSLLTEIGFTPVLVGLRDSSLGGVPAFEAVLRKNGVTLADDVEILQQPSMRLVREHLLRLLMDRKIHGLIGSTAEINLLSTLSLKERTAIHPRLAFLQNILFVLEVGFPALNYHVTHSVPTLGFGGAVAWAQRIINATGTIIR
jgi:nitrogenase molybdenum-iron protein alpha/beta subunit